MAVISAWYEVKFWKDFTLIREGSSQLHFVSEKSITLFIFV